MEHTPAPWKVVQRFNNDEHDDKCCSIEGGEDEYIIAEVCGDCPGGKANALLIVRAVNNHERLVNALKECRKRLKEIGESSGWVVTSALRSAEEAIAKLKEGE
jgi:hypothetical protein